MIEFSVLKTKVSVSPLFFAVLTLVLISDKTGISLFAALFSALHEAGHILALICGKISPKSFDITLFGIHILLPENLSTVEKCLVLMSGFTVNFLLAALFLSFGKTVFAVINIVLGIFTALPLPSTDGGAIFKTILDEYSNQKGERIFKFVSLSFFVMV